MLLEFLFKESLWMEYSDCEAWQTWGPHCYQLLELE